MGIRIKEIHLKPGTKLMGAITYVPEYWVGDNPLVDKDKMTWTTFYYRGYNPAHQCVYVLLEEQIITQKMKVANRDWKMWEDMIDVEDLTKLEPLMYTPDEDEPEGPEPVGYELLPNGTWYNDYVGKVRLEHIDYKPNY